MKEAGLKKRLLAANVKSMLLKHQIEKAQPQAEPQAEEAQPVGELPAGAARKLLGRRPAPATPIVSLPAGAPLNVPAGMVAQGTPNGVILRQETMAEKKARERLTKAQMNKIQVCAPSPLAEKPRREARGRRRLVAGTVETSPLSWLRLRRARIADLETPGLQAAERNWEKFKTHLIATEQQAERLYEAAQQAKAEAGMLEGPADGAAAGGEAAQPPAGADGASAGMMADAGIAGGE